MHAGVVHGAEKVSCLERCPQFSYTYVLIVGFHCSEIEEEGAYVLMVVPVIG